MKTKNQFDGYSFLPVLLTLTLFCGYLTSCKKDDPPLPDNILAFESTSVGIGAEDAGQTLALHLSRATDKDISVAISVTSSGVQEGVDYTIIPASASGVLTVTIAKGASDASIAVAKVAGIILDGTETLTFAITSATSPVVLGDQKSLVLSFSEILSQGSTLDIAGGGATFPNEVFIDLSANTQTAVLRTSWDLGFYTGADYKVIVNSTTAMMARALAKNDLNTVTAADTVGFANKMSISAFNPDAIAWVDAPSGDLTQTAIAAVSATDADNKVYIVNRGNGVGSPAPGRGWKKIRVLRSATGYTLQYADISATSFSTIQIAKEDTHLFSYVHFENGAVSVEPEKVKWDIAWSYFTNEIPNGPSNIPYGFQDLIIQNRNNVKTAKVLTSAVSYDAFTESNIAALTFSTSQLGIGSDWRQTSPSPASVFTDRFYVVVDPAGNYYKLKFNYLLKDGVRGTPEIQYALVKKAS